MDQFGVKKPSLKAIAKTPVIPRLFEFSEALETKVVKAFQESHWLGATLADLQGDAFSAYGVAKEDGGIALSEVPDGCEAKRVGFKHQDLIQSVSGKPVKTIADLVTALAMNGDAPLKVGFVRLQKNHQVTLSDSPFLVVESARTAQTFKQLPPPAAAKWKTETYGEVKGSTNDLVDGKLAVSYGPVYANGTKTGAYKLDLGTSKAISGITSWSFNMNGNRGPQWVSLYGSNEGSDPGWDVKDAKKFTPLGTIDTRSLPKSEFAAAALKARDGKSLGRFRWIIWRVAPVTDLGENTAFQELGVDVLE
jgi:hypothetical protein